MKASSFLLLAVLCSGCASTVEVSKLTRDIYPATSPERVEILKSKPDKAYKQIADVSAMQFPNGESARMWSEIRGKAAAVGANAVLITDEQTFRRDFVLYRSVFGVAIVWVPSP